MERNKKAPCRLIFPHIGLHQSYMLLVTAFIHLRYIGIHAFGNFHIDITIDIEFYM